MPSLITAATMEEIRAAYQLVLGRQADEAGLEHFRALARAQNLTAHEIALLLVDSDEFRAKNGRADEPVEISMHGYSIFVRASDRDIGGAIAKGVDYESHVSALLRRELRSGDTFLDVGANIGFFTMMAAHLVGPHGRVLAVEPMDKNLQLVYLGIEANGYDNVDVFPFGASDQSSLVPIVTDPNTSNALVQSAPSKKRPSCFAPTRTLDWMCAGLNRLDFVKMDIEGHEIFAWRGAKDLFSRFKPKITTEFHPLAMRENAGIDCRDYVDLMFAYCPEIKVIVSSDQIVGCSTFDEVMHHWNLNDQRHGGRGSSHLDLFLSPES
ncbi:FkbM family methyltransferase [Dokdonella sp.]|uniref:FkbM family methyltransferase n=1 Tax=Dokdonella sp. TaxID=2291710 RepID=UPI002B575226|nr:FkbM family methyltransferase [Dokdonella sp.]HOX72096.1 FkbM family methyltransferase [Dokdonella sp.]HPN80075.1 FkbM family methyltransferase [Dokdonella sp.]